MASRNRVFVLLDSEGNVTKIYRKHFGVYEDQAKGLNVVEWSRYDAVKSLRDLIYHRSGGNCEFCYKPITYNFHMHELIPRGEGGLMSLDNSWAICADCHINRPDSEHANRKPQFRKKIK